MDNIEVHPVQTKRTFNGAKCPAVVTRKAYEVYCHLYSPQPELVTGSCRGGFGVNELISFLYAHSFPKSEWRDRVDEALTGMREL